MYDEKFKERYTIPTRFDSEPFGTIVKCIGDNNDYEFYVQLSKDQANANWQKVRYLLEKTFQEFFFNATFIEECLKIYNGDKDFSKISKIIFNKP
jgi:hypothetical protein